MNGDYANRFYYICVAIGSFLNKRLIGNSVKFTNSTRCCESFLIAKTLQRHCLSGRPFYSKDKSEDLPNVLMLMVFGT